MILNANVVEKKQLNECVYRLICSEGVVIDVHESCPVNESDNIRVSLTDALIENSQYAMYGHVYKRDDTHTCLSFGGLLASLPLKLETNTAYMHIEKSNVRRRGLAQSTQKKRKT